MVAPADQFYGPRLKVKRANHHINELKRIFDRHVRENVEGMRGKRKRNPWEQTSSAWVGKPFPEYVPTVLGDAVHNLRAALDHAHCVLVQKNGGMVVRETMFPFAKTRDALERAIERQKKGTPNRDPIDFPSDRVMTYIIEDVMPYEGGKLGLYELHRLDIMDKHTVLIPTISAMPIERIEVIDQHGRFFGSIGGMTIIGPNDPNSAPSITVEAGLSLKMHGNPKTAFDIRFDKGQPFEGESIIQKLNALSDNVSAALDGLCTESE